MISESRKWGVYYVVGLVMKSYFRVSIGTLAYILWTGPDAQQVKTITLSRNILRALEANKDIPPLSSYPRAHQVYESIY